MTFTLEVEEIHQGLERCDGGPYSYLEGIIKASEEFPVLLDTVPLPSFTEKLSGFLRRHRLITGQTNAHEITERLSCSSAHAMVFLGIGVYAGWWHVTWPANMSISDIRTGTLETVFISSYTLAGIKTLGIER